MSVFNAQPGVRKLLENYQTSFDYKFKPTNGSYAIWVDFMNVPKQCTEA